MTPGSGLPARAASNRVIRVVPEFVRQLVVVERCASAIDGSRKFVESPIGDVFSRAAEGAHCSGLPVTTGDAGVVLYNTKNWEPIATMGGGGWLASAVAFSPDGERVLVGSGDGKVIICDVKSHRKVAVLKGHELFVNSIHFLDADTLFTADRYGDGCIWSAGNDEVTSD